MTDRQEIMKRRDSAARVAHHVGVQLLSAAAKAFEAARYAHEIPRGYDLAAAVQAARDAADHAVRNAPSARTLMDEADD